MPNLFITSDKIGIETGGGSVTAHELAALKSLGDRVDILNYQFTTTPFDADEQALAQYLKNGLKYKIAHIYAGTYTKLVEQLKKDGTKVTYTSAAHSIETSRAAHLELNIPYDTLYPHLVVPELREKYLRGYVEADVCIVPSKHSDEIVRSYGCKNVAIIPHGCNLPEHVKPIPKDFKALYLGQPGADKGLIYLIEAWAKPAFRNTQLTIAGRGTEQLLPMVRFFGGNIFLQGEVKNVANAYNNCSLYIQPSASEGFGMSVLEAMSYGRPVVCSTGAGAVDLVEDGVNGIRVSARSVGSLVAAIEYYKNHADEAIEHGKAGAEKAKNYTWPIIEQMYVDVWRNL